MPFTEDFLQKLTGDDGFFAVGIFALEQGWMYASIVLASIIDRKFTAVWGWLLAAAGFLALGILHNFRVIDIDITTGLGPVWSAVPGYLVAIAVIQVIRFTLISREVR
ncbi:hypothetical protein [Pelagicoccus sp. SDUM812002]|uniref:hypothetical protein n=1 Tax=Pelagicoccus sp. SDUM812002 TaxID=3041266 RepID=UPI00280D3007|nr:hypothetical protein [Pelagicoccus sp. SDUM812002]MDQ8185601.1 hypothetical protein [Pelagicoccus sp. SDUM812002]